VIAHVEVDAKRPVYVPLQNTCAIGAQQEGEGTSSFEVEHEVGELGPVIRVGFSVPGSEEGDCCAGVRPGLLGDVECFGHQVMELIGLI
jgi:hypothetical protein